MSDTVISVQKVSKAYRIWENSSSRLTAPLLEGMGGILFGRAKAALKARAAKSYRDFWALKNVSFEVKKGEAVGIIGRNGSGKSTLLQIIAGTLQPTEGTVKVNGRVAALLELGSGFNPEFTGRENVYLNGAVLGFSRAEIDARFESIAAFADIGDFIDQPIKTYSSGMMMRLAFSIQTSAEPEVLIVDEALAVGDAQFIAKCINRISHHIRNGSTLLFVSHEVGLVKQLTTRSLYLEQGQPVIFGSTPETVLAYMSALSIPATAPSTDPDRYAREGATYLIERATISQLDNPNPVQSFASGEGVCLTIGLVPGNPGTARLVFSIYNYMGIIVCSAEIDLPRAPEGKKSLIVKIALPHVRLAPGNYRFNFAVRNGIEIVAWARNAIYFNVTGTTTETFIYREDFETSFSFADQQ